MSTRPLHHDKHSALTDLTDKSLGAVQVETLMSELASAFLRQRVEGAAAPESGPKPIGPQLSNPEQPMYRALVEQIPAVIFIGYLDRGVSEAYVSPQIETALGFSQEEWLEDPIRWYQQIHPEDRGRWSIEAAEMFTQGKPLKSAYRIVARDGKIVWFRCEAKIVTYQDGRPWFLLGVGFDITELKRTEEALRERTEALRSLSANLFQLQDKERRRIAREMHDGLGQYLAALKINFDLLASQTNGRTSKWAETQELLQQCITETRTISYLLHPPMLDDAGLVLAVQWYVEGFAQRSGIKTTLNISPEFPRLPKAVELAIFRILQESLTNIHRHSGSKAADIILSAEGIDVSLEVRDHGCGIEPGLLKDFQLKGSQVGVGLAGMRERVHEIGGRFEIASGKHGTLTKVVIPKGATSESDFVEG